MRIIILIISLIFSPPSFTMNGEEKIFFGEWHFYIDRSKENKICYIYSKPIKSEGNYRKRNKPYFLVKNIENKNSEITISAGFEYQKNSEVKLFLQNKEFNIFTFENLAWSYNINQDLDIIKEMKKNNFLEIYSINKYGRYAKDYYSLEGFNHAHHKITEICNNHDSS